MSESHRRAVTDATGRALLLGLRPGRWRVQPAITRPDAARWTATVLVAEHETVPETVVEVPETGQVELTIRVRPATAIELRLACDDGGKVPMRASVALLEPHADAAWRSALPVGALEAVTTRDGLPLDGPQLDRLSRGRCRPAVSRSHCAPRGSTAGPSRPAPRIRPARGSTRWAKGSRSTSAPGR